MGVFKLITAPIRSIVRFPLFQLAVVVAVILLLQAADDNSAFGQIFNGLDKLVDLTVRSLSAVFNVKSFTKSWLTSGFMIAYVYLACLLILSLLRVTIRVAVDLVGRTNAFWLRNAIARERGIYLPLWQRTVRGVIGYVLVVPVAAVALQVFTPFPVLAWLSELTKMLFDRN